MQDYSHKSLAAALVLAADFSTPVDAAKAIVDQIGQNLSEHEAELLRNELAAALEIVRKSGNG